MIEPVFCLLLWRENERALLSLVWSGIRPYVMYGGGGGKVTILILAYTVHETS